MQQDITKFILALKDGIILTRMCPDDKILHKKK